MLEPNIGEIELEFPAKLHFLLTEPSRYKVLYGGRGAGKSEGIAIALILLSAMKRLRIACFRELQTSIAESVHALLKQKIYDLGFENEFKINDTSIVSKRTGSEFIFLGLRYNIDKIKSLAKIDIAWVEEAKNVSKVSWTKLGPTIRGRHESDPAGLGGPFGKGPEIWVSFNPELDDDETYKRFVLKPPNNYDHAGNRYAIIRKVNWTDNKWFPPDLRAEMEECRNRDEDEYLEVWEGHTKQVLDGAIFAEEIRKVLKEGRLGKVPYDTTRPVHTFWDLGHSDQTAIWFIQTVGVEYNVIDFYQNNLKKVGFYIKYLQDLGYIYGTHHLPHDAVNETLASKSVDYLIRQAGYKTKVIPAPAKKFIGINASRTVFDLCNFDEENTADGLTCLRRYCYAVNDDGLFSKEPAHNEYSHGADGFQTFALSLKSETASKKKSEKTVGSNSRTLSIPDSNSWMG